MPNQRLRRSSLSSAAASLQAEEADLREAVERSSNSNEVVAAHSVAGTNGRRTARKRYKHYTLQEAATDRLTLNFHHPTLERNFRRYVSQKAIRRTRGAALAFIFCLLCFGILENVGNFSGVPWATAGIGGLRIVTAIVPTLFLLLSERLTDLPVPWLESALAATYGMHGILLVAANVLGVYAGSRHYYPFAWWSGTFDMCHCAVTQLSGVRFAVAACVTLIHPLLVCLAYIPGYRPANSDEVEQLLIQLACIAVCILVAYRREAVERREFVSTANLIADRTMRQDLLDEMLPSRVAEALNRRGGSGMDSFAGAGAGSHTSRGTGAAGSLRAASREFTAGQMASRQDSPHWSSRPGAAVVGSLLSPSSGQTGVANILSGRNTSEPGGGGSKEFFADRSILVPPTVVANTSVPPTVPNHSSMSPSAGTGTGSRMTRRQSSQQELGPAKGMNRARSTEPDIMLARSMPLRDVGDSVGEADSPSNLHRPRSIRFKKRASVLEGRRSIVGAAISGSFLHEAGSLDSPTLAPLASPSVHGMTLLEQTELPHMNLVRAPSTGLSGLARNSRQGSSQTQHHDVHSRLSRRSTASSEGPAAVALSSTQQVADAAPESKLVSVSASMEVNSMAAPVPAKPTDVPGTEAASAVPPGSHVNADGSAQHYVIDAGTQVGAYAADSGAAPSGRSSVVATGTSTLHVQGAASTSHAQLILPQVLVRSGSRALVSEQRSDGLSIPHAPTAVKLSSRAARKKQLYASVFHRSVSPFRAASATATESVVGMHGSDRRTSLLNSLASFRRASGGDTPAPSMLVKAPAWDPVAHLYPRATVMFVYIANLTALTAIAQPIQLVTFLNAVYTQFDEIVTRRRAYKVMAIANMYLVVSGAPSEDPDHAVTMVQVALDIMKLVQRQAAHGGMDLSGVRAQFQIGLHSGEVAGGVIGQATLNWHIFGDTVNTASRMCSVNASGRIQLSPVTVELLRAHVKTNDDTDFIRSAVADDDSGTVTDVPFLQNCPTAPVGTILPLRLRPGSVTLECRGAVPFKGKGEICTWWLSDKELEYLNNLQSLRIPSRTGLSAGQPLPSPRAQAAILPGNPSVQVVEGVGVTDTSLTTEYDHAVQSEGLDSITGRGDGPVEQLVEVEATHALWQNFLDDNVEEKYQAKIMPKVTKTLALAFVLGFVVAGGGMLKSLLFDVRSRPLGLALDVGLSRGVLALACMVYVGALLYDGAAIRNRLLLSAAGTQTTVSKWLPELAVPLCIGATFVLNAELLPGVARGANSDSGLANLNFLLLLVFSFMELRSYTVIYLNVSCLCVYISLLVTVGVYPLVYVLSHALMVVAAAVFSSTIAWVRESARRFRFIVHEKSRAHKNECEKILLNMLPSASHASRLMEGEQVVEELDDVTLLYSDIRGFTQMSSSMSAEALIEFLDALYTNFDEYLPRYGVYKIETIGDAFIVVGGLQEAASTAGAKQGAAARPDRPQSDTSRRVSTDGSDDGEYTTENGVSDGKSFTAILGRLGGWGRRTARLPKSAQVAPFPPTVSSLEKDAPVGIVMAAPISSTSDFVGPSSSPSCELPIPPLGSRDELDHAGRVALFSIIMLDLVRVLQRTESMNLQMRIGIHCGRVVAGVIGRTRPRYFVWGKDCDLANNMESTGEAMQVQVSEVAALRLARQGFRLVPHQRVPLDDMGKHGAQDDAPCADTAWMQTYLLVGCDRVQHGGTTLTVDMQAAAAQHILG